MKYTMDSFIRHLSGICITYAILKISRIKIHFQNPLIAKRISNSICILQICTSQSVRIYKAYLQYTQFRGIFIRLKQHR